MAVQKAMVLRENTARVLGKVMHLKSRWRTSSQFLAYMNLRGVTRLPLALIDEVCAQVQHLSLLAVFECEAQEALHRGVVAVGVEGVRFVQLDDRLFRDEGILRLISVHINKKYYRWAAWGCTNQSAVRVASDEPIIKSVRMNNKFIGRVRQAIKDE